MGRDNAADLAHTAALTRSRITGRLPTGRRAHRSGRLTTDAALIQAARQVNDTASGTGPGCQTITELGPFAAPLPRSNPLAPAATALQYARAETHHLSMDNRLGVTALRDLTLLGLSISQHTDAITRAAAAQTGTHLPADRARAAAETLAPAADHARTLARRWRDLYGQLQPLRSAHPPQPGLAHAALAVRAGLEAHTRRDGRWATPTEMHPTRQHMEELLTGIRAVALPMEELARAGEHGIEHLHRRGQLYIDARALPTDPQLLHAQSTGRYVPLPAANAEELGRSWREVAQAGRELTTTLATSVGLAGQHPRQAAALARTTRFAGSTTGAEGAHVERDTNIESVRRTLRTIAVSAERASATIDGLSASLTRAGADAATLDAMAAILDAADDLKSKAEKTLSGMNARHTAVEEAVNTIPRSAVTRLYRHER